MGIKKPQLKKLFFFATKQTHFTFKDVLYDQVDRVAMDSSLTPALANFFLGHYENLWLNNTRASTVLFYKRYVDGIFCLFEKEQYFHDFFLFINDQHQNIRFTFEKEINGILPFLNVLITVTDTCFQLTTFYKKSIYWIIDELYQFY